MRLILVGAEYTGKSTLVEEIAKWGERTLGPRIPTGMRPYHDHFTLPEIAELSEEEFDQVEALSPTLKLMFLTYQIGEHLHSNFVLDHDHILVGFHIEDAIYGPLYYGYGMDGSRSRYARAVETEIMEKAPDTVLVLLKASAEVIAKRMRENPHPRGVLKEKDIEHVLQRFEEEYASTLLRYHFTLDTTAATVDETLNEFVELMLPQLTVNDRLRMLTRQQPLG
jgi:thymidylate kinase